MKKIVALIIVAAASLALGGCAGTKTGDYARERAAVATANAKERATAAVDKVLAKDWTLWVTRFASGRWGFGIGAGTFANPTPATPQPAPAPVVVIRERNADGKTIRRPR